MDRVSKRLIVISVVLAIALFVMFAYTFLHEAGHALVGMAFGQSLTRFNVNFWNLQAHVGMSGSLTQAQSALRSVAGTVLPLLVWFAFMWLVPRKGSFGLEVLKLVASMAVIHSLVSWIILPLMYLAGSAPPDDVTNFWQTSQLPPLLISAAALGLYVGGWLVFLAKIEGLRNQILIFRQPMQAVSNGLRPYLAIIGGLALALLALTFLANNLKGQNRSDQFSLPQVARLVAQVDLALRAYQTETLAQFSLEQEGQMEIFVTIERLDTPYLNLSLSSPDGYQATIVRGEGFKADTYDDRWQQILPPGEYRLVLDANQSQGLMSIFVKTP